MSRNLFIIKPSLSQFSVGSVCSSVLFIGGRTKSISSILLKIVVCCVFIRSSLRFHYSNLWYVFVSLALTVPDWLNFSIISDIAPIFNHNIISMPNSPKNSSALSSNLPQAFVYYFQSYRLSIFAIILTFHYWLHPQQPDRIFWDHPHNLSLYFSHMLCSN